MKTRILLSTLLSAILFSCSTEKHVFGAGDIVRINHAEEKFRIDEQETRKTGAATTWNGTFYRVTHLGNGKQFSLPQRSLVLVEKKQQPIQPQPERVLAGAGE